MSETVEINCDVIRETSEALRIKKGDMSCWIPKSQLTEQLTGMFPKKDQTIEIPVWLAEGKGLV